MYVQDLSKMIDDKIDIKIITAQLASGDIQYAYPYAMKEFLIKYSRYVLETLLKI